MEEFLEKVKSDYKLAREFEQDLERALFSHVYIITEELRQKVELELKKRMGMTIAHTVFVIQKVEE